MQYSFGAGSLFGRSLNNTPPTPVRFGALQDVTIDFSFNVKELYGGYQFPLAIGRGTGKITGKASFAQFNAQVYNDLFFGLSNPATGRTVTVIGEAQTVTSNAVTVTNNATFTRDLGVTLASDGTTFARVANSPVGQQYSCNESTGVYTFNSSQNNAAVQVSYQYSDAANGKTIAITNQLLGAAPTFLTAFTEVFQGKKITTVLNNCTSSKLSLLTTKLEDFSVPSFEFQAQADSSGNLGNIYLDE